MMKEYPRSFLQLHISNAISLTNKAYYKEATFTRVVVRLTFTKRYLLINFCESLK